MIVFVSVLILFFDCLLYAPKKTFWKGVAEMPPFFMKKMLDKKFYMWYNMGLGLRQLEKIFLKNF